MIKPEQYKQEQKISYVTMDMIKGSHTKREVRRFREWYSGQTGILVDGSICGIYTHDYERWLKDGMPTCQGADWD